MTDAELGKATIVYETPDGKTDDETVDNEHVAYFQDHWIVRTDESEDGVDTIRRIPATRVYYVERDVEEFQEEVRTLRDQVQSFASDVGGEVRTLRDRLESMAGGLQGDRRRDETSDGSRESDAEPIEIEVGEGPRDRSPGAGSPDESDVGDGSDVEKDTDAGEAPDEDDDHSR